MRISGRSNKSISWKRAITFGPTVGSHSNFYRGFERLFSLGKQWNRCWVTRMSGCQPWVLAQKGHNILSDRWIMLKFLQGFPEAVFRGVYMECLLGDEDVWSTEQEYRLKKAITIGPTVGSRSNFYWVSRGCFCLVSYGIAEWRGCLVSNLEYQLKRAITFHPTVWSLSKFYCGFEWLFSLGKQWNRCWVTRMSGRQPWVSTQKSHNILSDRWITLKVLHGFPEVVFRGVYTECLLGDEDVWSTEQEYRLKRSITFGPTVGSHSNFYRGF
jgi:hypothetical protein